MGLEPRERSEVEKKCGSKAVSSPREPAIAQNSEEPQDLKDKQRGKIPAKDN